MGRGKRALVIFISALLPAAISSPRVHADTQSSCAWMRSRLVRYGRAGVNTPTLRQIYQRSCGPRIPLATARPAPRPQTPARPPRRMRRDGECYRHVEQAAAEYGVPAELLRALFDVESGGNPTRVSATGCTGCGQLSRRIARGCGITDRKQAKPNVRCSARYLRKLLDRFSGDEVRAIAAYNRGPNAIHATAPYCLALPNLPFVRNVFRRHRQRGRAFVKRHLTCPRGSKPIPLNQHWYHPHKTRVLPRRAGSRFGAPRGRPRKTPCGAGHCGVDLYQPTGAPVYLVTDGKIRWIGTLPRCGLALIVTHLRATSTYCHLHSVQPQLRVGDQVPGGTLVAAVGRTGMRYSAAHLHLNINVLGRFIDPVPYLRVARMSPQVAGR